MVIQSVGARLSALAVLSLGLPCPPAERPPRSQAGRKDQGSEGRGLGCALGGAEAQSWRGRSSVPGGPELRNVFPAFRAPSGEGRGQPTKGRACAEFGISTAG